MPYLSHRHMQCDLDTEKYKIALVDRVAVRRLLGAVEDHLRCGVAEAVSTLSAMMGDVYKRIVL